LPPLLEMIFLTGDTHGSIDISKVSGKNWKEGKLLTKDDYLIVVGDFGLLWCDEPDSAEKWWIDWLTNKNWTTLFIDGNHENHNRLKQLETVEMFGSEVGKVNTSIYHLRRGHIYQIEGHRFLAFGGAKSTDKEYRTDQVSWWPEEVPNQDELNLALKNLATHNMQVDYLLFHTIPTRLFTHVGLESGDERFLDPTCEMLEAIVSTIQFQHGYSGHFHVDRGHTKWTFLYDRIVKIAEAK